MELGPAALPMKPHAADMVFIQGLYNQTAQASTSPHLGRMNVLSGAPVSLDPNEIRVGTSMDQVVASQIGGVPEQLSDETGVLVEPESFEALAEAVGRLLEDEARLQRMGRAAATDAKARFSLDRQIDAYVDLYAEVAGC